MASLFPANAGIEELQFGRGAAKLKSLSNSLFAAGWFSFTVYSDFSVRSTLCLLPRARGCRPSTGSETRLGQRGGGPTTTGTAAWLPPECRRRLAGGFNPETCADLRGRTPSNDHPQLHQPAPIPALPISSPEPCKRDAAPRSERRR